MAWKNAHWGGSGVGESMLSLCMLAAYFATAIESTALSAAVYWDKSSKPKQDKTARNIIYLRTSCQAVLNSRNAADRAVYEDISPQRIGMHCGATRQTLTGGVPWCRDPTRRPCAIATSQEDWRRSVEELEDMKKARSE